MGMHPRQVQGGILEKEMKMKVLLLLFVIISTVLEIPIQAKIGASIDITALRILSRISVMAVGMIIGRSWPKS